MEARYFKKALDQVQKKFSFSKSTLAKKIDISRQGLDAIISGKTSKVSEKHSLNLDKLLNELKASEGRDVSLDRSVNITQDGNLIIGNFNKLSEVAKKSIIDSITKHYVMESNPFEQ